MEEVAWDADMLRGARGVYATTDVEPVARPFDRVAIEARARGSGLLAALGLRGDALRGGPLTSLDAVGPVMTLAASGSTGEVGAAHVTVDGGVVRVPGGSSLSYARGVAGLMLAGRLGALGASASLLAAGDVASDGDAHAKDGAAHARIELGLPFGRAVGAWRHRIEPVASVSGLLADGDGALAVGVQNGIAAGGGAAVLQGEALTAGGGLRTSLGRWAKGEGFELEGIAGTVTSSAAADSIGVARWRAAAQSRFFALSAEGGHLLANVSGHAWVARARAGETTGFFLKAWVASREGLDPVAARLLTDPSMEAPLGFLNEGGWTGGARAGIPWAKYVTTRGGVDVDFSSQALVAAVGTLELRDGCGCFRLRASAAHRMGRDGVDIWISVDVTPEMLRR